MRNVFFLVWSVSFLIVTMPTYAAESTASAEVIPTHPLLRDEFVFTLGGIYTRNVTDASLGPGGGGAGVIVNFEDTLDLDQRNLTPIAGLLWRVSDRWRMVVNYFSVSRDASSILAADIQWGDYTFTAGSTVNSLFNFSDVRVSGAYSFFKRTDKELGVGLGLHVADIKAGIDASGIGGDTASVTAPLPVINFYGMFALTEEWAVSMSADWLSLTYGDYSGDVRNMEINVVYQPFDNLGFGLGMRSMVVDVSIDNSDWNGKARINYSGPTAFISMSF